MAETIIYNGSEYKRINGKWVDRNNMVVTHLQKTLDNQFYKLQDLGALSAEELVKEGDKFKEAGTVHLAIKNYEAALQVGGLQEKRYVLPRVMSCYRLQNQPMKAIEIYTRATQEGINYLITEPMCVSAAAAYCDLGDFERAQKCADRAYAICNGKASGELHAVYGRIKKETA